MLKKNCNKWCFGSDWADKLARLHAGYRAGELALDELAAHPDVLGVARIYRAGFWQRHQSHIQSRCRNVDAQDLMGPILGALCDGFQRYDPGYGRGLTEYLSLRMYQACVGEMRANYAAKRAHWQAWNFVSLDEVECSDGANYHRERQVVEKEILRSGDAERLLPHPGQAIDGIHLRAAVDRLPHPMSQIMRLHYFEQYSYAEIAARLWPQAPQKHRVKQYIDQALIRLRCLIG